MNTSNIFAAMGTGNVYHHTADAPRPVFSSSHCYDPPAETLRKLPPAQLEKIHNFTVSTEYGQVCWPGAVDILGVDFTRDIVFSKGSCEVYARDPAPPRGQKLNKHAIITLFGIHFTVEEGGQNALLRLIEEQTAVMGARFLAFNNVSGEWSFSVDYFV